MRGFGSICQKFEPKYFDNIFMLLGEFLMSQMAKHRKINAAIWSHWTVRERERE